MAVNERKENVSHLQEGSDISTIIIIINIHNVCSVCFACICVCRRKVIHLDFLFGLASDRCFYIHTSWQCVFVCVCVCGAVCLSSLCHWNLTHPSHDDDVQCAAIHHSLVVHQKERGDRARELWTNYHINIYIWSWALMDERNERSLDLDRRNWKKCRWWIYGI